MLQIGDSVNAKAKGRYYGAFITAVHSDMTYNVYFTEDPDYAGENIPHKDIKQPMQTERSRKFSTWHKYIGKIFFDEGTMQGDDPENPDYYLEAGEWVVDHVAEDNTFLCMRIGRPHDDANNLHFDIGYVIRRIRKYEEE